MPTGVQHFTLKFWNQKNLYDAVKSIDFWSPWSNQSWSCGVYFIKLLLNQLKIIENSKNKNWWGTAWFYKTKPLLIDWLNRHTFGGITGIVKTSAGQSAMSLYSARQLNCPLHVINGQKKPQNNRECVLECHYRIQYGVSYSNKICLPKSLTYNLFYYVQFCPIV